jgi:putative restriction endonuclease
MITLGQIEDVLDEFNVTERHEVQYAIQFFLPSIGQYFYINKQAGGKASGLVIHPRFESHIDRLLSIEGVQTTGTLNHKSSFRRFPRRLNRGNEPIPFGIPFGFETISSMREFIENLKETKPYYIRNPEEEIVDAEESGDFSGLPDTEVERIVSSRRGQGKYRKDLILIWGKCSVTGCEQLDLLKASHIKPWRDSNNFERLDPYNGLLLTPNLDALFDSGAITFDSRGKIVISSLLDNKTCTTMGLDRSEKLSTINDNCERYLEYHREFIFQY